MEGSFDAMVRAIERAAGLRRRAEGVLPVHRKAGSAKRHCPPQAMPAMPQAQAGPASGPEPEPCVCNTETQTQTPS